MRGRILGRRNKNITHIPYLSVPEEKEICFTRMQLEFQSVGRIQLRHTWLATTCKIDPWNPETFCVDEIYTIPKMFLEPHIYHTWSFWLVTNAYASKFTKSYKNAYYRSKLLFLFFFSFHKNYFRTKKLCLIHIYEFILTVLKTYSFDQNFKL